MNGDDDVWGFATRCGISNRAFVGLPPAALLDTV